MKEIMMSEKNKISPNAVVYILITHTTSLFFQNVFFSFRLKLESLLETWKHIETIFFFWEKRHSTSCLWSQFLVGEAAGPSTCYCLKVHCFIMHVSASSHNSFCIPMNKYIYYQRIQLPVQSWNFTFFL